MAASVKSSRTFGTTNQIEALRLRLVAGELGKRVGDRIREARLEKEARSNKKFGQRQLADLVAELTSNDAIDNQRVSDWERGIHAPNDANMRAIAEVLEKPVAWFYAEQEESTTTPNLMGVLDGESQLDRIEEKVDALIAFFAGLENAKDQEAARDALRALAVVAAAGASGAGTQPAPPAGPQRHHQAG